MFFGDCTLRLDLVLVFQECFYSTYDIHVTLISARLLIEILLNRHCYCGGLDT